MFSVKYNRKAASQETASKRISMEGYLWGLKYIELLWGARAKFDKGNPYRVSSILACTFSKGIICGVNQKMGHRQHYLKKVPFVTSQ